MKQLFKTHKILVLTALLFISYSCEEFLDRPTEDNYTIDSFYKTDEQCFQAANVLYSAPWYDFQRGFVWIGDVLAGNMYLGTDNNYQNFNLTSSNEDLANAANSLWLVNGHCNAVIENIRTKAGPDVSEETRNTVTGEAMVWKAMAYFYLVRIWGAIPIIHSNSEIIGAGNATELPKNQIEDVYEYIVRTLLKAIELLPEQNIKGRINKTSAYGLLAKVYLTRSGYGQNGTRNQADLDKAKEYAAKVVNESGLSLEPVYSNLFRISTGNFNEENLLSWRWVASDQWTSQNSLQSDLSLNGFTGLNDSWGTWRGPTIDLQFAFNEDAREPRNNRDDRRKATMMMKDDYYPYFWRHVGGFTCTWDDDNNVAGATFGIGTGANCVKHIVGHFEGDHKDEAGVPARRMATDLATHILRLADVYLIYAEAILGNNETTSDAEALKAFNAVRKRSISAHTDVSSISFEDIFKERRLELALECDNWYDFVRLHYYKPELAKQWLNNQERGSFNGLRQYYDAEIEKSEVTIESFKVNITSDSKFQLPFPEVDLAMNPNLRDDVEPVPFDFSTIEY
ncbi:RagB/SusD family nutrient uptake outer membrane protein [Maribellus comscasis]|uniref:RagB/SusD family nutrient uptake outer membrane protein n=1 Tax=Maribellus comscasis TaxID=2681766 RepID=A0A6I6K2D8_9BACT|nr:RagB/SusD family nutrient uptake outer membrane protein [Maribellus comscasis]QGY44074.1 RagB/SusD family nutrient uptake outer membrane protein [Maribellus comscasis]